MGMEVEGPDDFGSSNFLGKVYQSSTDGRFWNGEG